MRGNKSLGIEAKASLAYTICSIIQKCIGLVTLPFFMRLLTKEQFGEVVLYSSWNGIISIFITLNLAYGSFSRAMIKFENRDAYVSSVQGVSTLLSLFFVVIYLCGKNYFSVILELSPIMVLLLVFEIWASNNILLWYARQRFDYKYISVITVTIISSVLSVLLQFIFVFAFYDKGIGKILGGAVVTIFFGVVFFCINLKKGAKLFEKEYWTFAFGFNGPLIFYYLSQIIFNQSDRIMISHMCDIEKAAVYGAGYNLALMFMFVLNSVNNSYVPWFYKKVSAGEANDNKKVSLYLFIGIGAILLGIVWLAPELIYIVDGEKYADAVWVVPPVTMSVLLLFLSQLYINIEFYFEEKKKLAISSVLAAILNLLLNYYLIPIMGYYVAGYTTYISYIFFALCNYLSAKKIMQEKKLGVDVFDGKGLLVIFCIFTLLSLGGIALYSNLVLRSVILVIIYISVFCVFIRTKNFLCK